MDWSIPFGPPGHLGAANQVPARPGAADDAGGETMVIEATTKEKPSARDGHGRAPPRVSMISLRQRGPVG